MGSFSAVHWLLVAIVVLVLFGGRGKISSLMGDFAQGIKAFKKGMSDDESADKKDTKTIDHQQAAASVEKTDRKVEGSVS
ncbi:MAG TPA: twin-arginine translocase TatA/TatE family subunit [Pseudolabrys sp.]|nr:twin-arginine translocase TatA/TatE family subunit [Pseudolabrys sp.]